MTAVPGIELQQLIQGVGPAQLRMLELAGVIFRAKFPEQKHPSSMEALQQRQGGLDRRSPDIGKFGPASFVIRFDCGLGLGQRQLEPGIRVEVAVRYMVDYLPDRPAIWPIRSVQLLRRKVRDGGTQVPRGGADFGNAPRATVSVRFSGKLKRADRIAQIFHYWDLSSARELPPGLDAVSGGSPLNSKCSSLRTRSWIGASEISSKRSRASTTSAIRAAGSHCPGVSVGYR